MFIMMMIRRGGGDGHGNNDDALGESKGTRPRIYYDAGDGQVNTHARLTSQVSVAY